MMSAALPPAAPGLPAVPSAGVPSGAPAEAGGESAPGGFARALDAAQTGHKDRGTPAAEGAVKPDAHPGREAAGGGTPRAAAEAAAPGARPATLAKAAAGKAAAAGNAPGATGRGGAPRTPDGGTLAADERAGGTAERNQTGREASAPAADPTADPAALLADLRARVSTGGEARTAAAALVGAEARPPASASPMAGRAQAGDGRQGKGVPAAVGTGPASLAPGAAETDARTLLQSWTDAQTPSSSETPAARADASGTPLAPALPALLPAAASGGAAAMAEARLAAAPGSAEFSSQLGAQLTTFVREGVQQARLHLNPAELGPVTVRIQIDGQAAQVHMAAEHALTRQALEQSMPLLAGNLREAGLTLSGGGVFEQPRQRDGGDTPGQPGTGNGSAPGGERGAAVPLHGAAGAPARRGVVDLVA